MKELGAEFEVGEGASVKVFLAVVFGERLSAGEGVTWALWADVDVGELTYVHVRIMDVRFVTSLDVMD